jgi:hypothetical protein
LSNEKGRRDNRGRKKLKRKARGEREERGIK